MVKVKKGIQKPPGEVRTRITGGNGGPEQTLFKAAVSCKIPGPEHLALGSFWKEPYPSNDAITELSGYKPS